MAKTAINKKVLKNQKTLILMGIPFAIYAIIFSYVPLFGWIMGLQNYKPKDGFFHSKWVGLGKFERLFKDDTFLKVIRNTFCMGAMNLVFGTVCAILFAILLNEFWSIKGKKVIQTVSYLPHFLSWIIVTSICFDVLSMENGVLNDVLHEGTIRVIAESLLDTIIIIYGHAVTNCRNITAHCPLGMLECTGAPCYIDH
jgi:putative aldouronate transport system permease protein